MSKAAPPVSPAFDPAIVQTHLDAEEGTQPGRAIRDVPSAEHINHTPFPSQYFQSVDQHGEVFHIIALRVTYDMQSLRADGSMNYAAEQTPLATEDHWAGEVNTGCPHWESDFAPYKPKCDVLVAHAVTRPTGGAARRWSCGIALEWQNEEGQSQQWHKQLVVTGPRQFGLLSLGEPQPASEVAIDWRHAYGGQDKRPADDEKNADGSIRKAAGADHWSVDERNPVGAGLDKRSGQPGPQLEVSGSNPYTDGIGQASYPPVSLNPLGRAWLPRRTLAGTYDNAWLKDQWPLPPMDFDYGYWNCAPEDQQTEYLPPGTRIHLIQLHAAHSEPGQPESWSGRLPLHQLFVHAYYRGVPGRGPDIDMDLDTLVVDLQAQQVYATYRLVLPAVGPNGALVLEARMNPVGQPDESVPASELGPLG